MRPLLRLKPYVLKYRRLLALGFIAVVASNLFTVVQPMLVGFAIDNIKSGVASKSIDATRLLEFALMIVGLSVIAGIFSFMTRQTLIVMSRHIEFDLRNDFLSHIQSLPLAYFQNTPTGDLMAHATNDIGSVRNAVGPGIMYPTDTLMTFTMTMGLMLYNDWKLTLLALIPLPFVSYAVYKLGKVIHEKFEERQAQFSMLTTRAQENLSGIRIVKAYVREEYEIDIFNTMSVDYLKKNLVLARVQSIMWPLMFMLVGFSLVITLYFGGRQVIAGEISIGTLTAFFGYLVMLIWPMIAFGWVTNLLQQGAASMSRLAKILDTKTSIADSDQTNHTIADVSGDIEFRNVTFTHLSATNPSLKNINWHIKKGTTVAIVGYTGSGKSTLVNLIPRLYEATGGELLIDGVDIRKIPIDVLRRNIGYVPQETFLFSDSIAENIAYGRNDNAGVDLHDDVAAAAGIAQMSRDIADFPKGFETMLGERGITLSGGQKQRTSIARAVMRNPRILILDDSLSAVDTYTEDEILKGLKGIMKDRTSIIISHRISTVKNADEIVVLKEGAIAERGNHDHLVSLGGIYAELYEKQLLEEELNQLE